MYPKLRFWVHKHLYLYPISCFWVHKKGKASSTFPFKKQSFHLSSPTKAISQLHIFPYLILSLPVLISKPKGMSNF